MKGDVKMLIVGVALLVLSLFNGAIVQDLLRLSDTQG